MVEHGNPVLNKFLTIDHNIPSTPDEDIARATAYWNRWLGPLRVEPAMASACKRSIVVSSYGEDTRTANRQLMSLRRQRGVDFAHVETIFVVNNDVPELRKNGLEVYDQNQRTIDLLSNVDDFPVRILDRSSRGREIANCSIGRARNCGTAEGSKRFFDKGRNGVLLNTDADTFFDDIEYLSRVIKITDENPDIIGIAGGVIYEGTSLSNEAFELFARKRRWDALTTFLRDPDRANYSIVHANAFWGAHILSRSFESAVVGGFVDSPNHFCGEDSFFGLTLQSYAETRGSQVLGDREGLVLTTEWRRSDRTNFSFANVFSPEGEGHLLVPHPDEVIAQSTIPVMTEKLIDSLENVAELRKMFTNTNGELVMSEGDIAHLVDTLGNTTGIQRKELFYKWIDANMVNFYTFLVRLYQHHAANPSTQLTESTLESLVRHVKLQSAGEQVLYDLARFDTSIVAPVQRARYDGDVAIHVSNEVVADPLKELEEGDEASAAFAKKIRWVIDNGIPVIAIEPHLDDGAMSSGSLLSYFAEQNVPVTKITLFTSASPRPYSSFARGWLHNTDYPDADISFSRRKDEDGRACDALGGITPAYLDFVDAAWRRKHDNKDPQRDYLYPKGYAIPTDIMTFDGQDALLLLEMQKKLCEILPANEQFIVFGPSAAKGHVDHVLTQTLLSQTFQDWVAWGDYPYSATYPQFNEEFLRKNELLPVVWKGSQGPKNTAIAEYASQLPALFTSGEVTFPMETYYFTPTLTHTILK